MVCVSLRAIIHKEYLVTLIITLAPGENRTTPVSLTSQFRRVYLTKPDLAPIIHAKMLSHGFGMPKTLTASLLAVITTFYKIAPKGLMKLPGLSLVRQVQQC
jgi:hypothetical protein